MHIGVDIGGTNARIAAFERADPETLLAKTQFPVQRGGQFADDYANLVRTIREVAGGEEIETVGLAVAGNVSQDRSHITGAGNLVHWIGRPISQQLVDDLGCRDVVLGNDAEAAALAEAMYGDEAQGSDFWFLIWGTGIGGTLVRHIGGKPVPLPGEPGHQILDPSSVRECGCGHRGCLESLCGGDGIRQQYGLTPEELTPDHWDVVLRDMAKGVYNLLTVQSTSLVIFGGGIAAGQPRLVYGLQRRICTLCHIVEAPTVRPSQYGKSAGTIGALALHTLNN